VGTSVLTEPGAPPPPGPSLLDEIIDYQLPILVGFLILLLAIRLLGDRRRKEVGGPSPQDLSGRTATPTGAGTPAPTAPVGAPVGAGAGQAEMIPFCWKCGTTLKGSESHCPSCGVKF
jgi:hypothetical protein